MTLKRHAKLEEKLTCGLENDMRPFVQNKKTHELKIYRGIMCNDTEE